MEKIEALHLLNETMSNHLFDCYRIALDYGLDVGSIAADAIAQQEEYSENFVLDKDKS